MSARLRLLEAQVLARPFTRAACLSLDLAVLLHEDACEMLRSVTP